MIRVAGPQPTPNEDSIPEPQVPEASMQESEPMYSVEKQMIMEAQNLIQQALALLLEVCPPGSYEEEPMEEGMPMEEPLPEDGAVPEEVV